MDVVTLGAAKADAKKKYLSFVPPSGDTTGATDLANINAALTARSFARLASGAVYYCNGPIVLPDSSSFEAYGAKIHKVNAGNLFQTVTAIPARSVSDAVATSGSTTLTSATAAFTSADVGAMVSVRGAGARYSTGDGQSWYAKITAVTNSTTVTMSKAASTTISAAKADVFPTRASNISVRGGYWNFDVDQPTGHTATSTYMNALCTAFRRVDQLTIRDVTIYTAGTKSQGGKFCISIADATNVTVDNINFVDTAGDGVHLTGPIARATVSNIRGTTGDDFVVVNPQDSNTPYITDTEGNYDDITVRDLTPSSALSAFKCYDIGDYKRWTSTGITIDNVAGSCTAMGVQIGYISSGSQPAQVNRTTVRNVSCSVGNGQNAVIAWTSGDLKIDDVQWTSTSYAASNGIVQVYTPRGVIDIRNVRLTSHPSAACVGVLIGSGGAFSGSTFGQSIIIDGVYNVRSGSAASTTFTAVSLSGVSGTLPSMRITNAVSEGTTGSLLAVANSATITSLKISRCTWAGTSVLASASGTAPITAQISDVDFSGTSLVSALCPVTLALSAVASVNSSALVAVTGANGSARVTGNATLTGSSTAAVSRDSTQSISVNGATLRADVSTLTPTDGDLATNTNAALGCGAGPAVYNATAAKWKGLYSGATN